MTRTPRTVLTLVTPELRDEIKTLADKYGLSIHDLIIKAIELYDKFYSEELSDEEYRNELVQNIDQTDDLIYEE